MIVSQRPHWWFFIRQIMFAVLVTGVWLAWLVLIGWSIIVTAIAFVIAASVLGFKSVFWLGSRLEINESYVQRRYLTKWLVASVESVQISDILSSEQTAGTIFEQFFGSGDLRLKTANDEATVFTDIARIGYVVEVLQSIQNGEPLASEDVSVVSVEPVEGLLPDLDLFERKEMPLRVVSRQRQLNAGLSAALAMLLAGIGWVWVVPTVEVARVGWIVLLVALTTAVGSWVAWY